MVKLLYERSLVQIIKFDSENLTRCKTDIDFMKLRTRKKPMTTSIVTQRCLSGKQFNQALV